MKLSEWARQQGVSYQTAWRWVKEGKMPVPVSQAPSGTWIVEESKTADGRVVAYCRVSSGDQRSDLDRQAIRVLEGANEQGLPVS
ncbi:IS607 family transposase, partial [Streptomyces sp. NPDC096040]